MEAIDKGKLCNWHATVTLTKTKNPAMYVTKKPAFLRAERGFFPRKASGDD